MESFRTSKAVGQELEMQLDDSTIWEQFPEEMLDRMETKIRSNGTWVNVPSDHLDEFEDLVRLCGDCLSPEDPWSGEDDEETLADILELADEINDMK